MGDYFRVCRELNEAKSTIARLERELAESESARVHHCQTILDRDQQIAELREAAQKGCVLYCGWYDRGEPKMEPSAMAYELKSILSALANTEPRNETGGGEGCLRCRKFSDDDLAEADASRMNREFFDTAPQEGE